MTSSVHGGMTKGVLNPESYYLVHEELVGHGGGLLMPDRLLRLSEVLTRVPFSRSALYAKANRGEFPSPVKLGARRVAWSESQVQAWIAAKVGAYNGSEQS